MKLIKIIAIICLLLTDGLSYNGVINQDEYKSPKSINKQIVGSWLNTTVVELIKKNKSLLNTYKIHDVENEGDPLLTFHFEHDTLIRMLSEFHDSGFDQIVNIGDTLYNIFHLKTDYLYFSDTNKITWHNHGFKWVYRKISDNYDNLDSLLNYFILDILFNNKTYFDSTNSEYLFFNGKIIINGTKTLNYSIEYDGLTLFEYESDILYIGENNELNRFYLIDDELILINNERRLVLKNRNFNK